MANLILADSITSISEFKKNPLAAVEQGQGFPVAVLNRNQPAFYCVPAEAYELLMGKLEDMELSALVSARKDQREVEFNIDDLEPAAQLLT
jgi:antitoxin StbD|tara:strand:- start:197 stop:469 length:273 start_codon:yes stop_codon:yes gene_type:complete